MNLDEAELWKTSQCVDGSKKDEEFEAVTDDVTVNEKLLDECVTKVLKQLFGKSWDTSIKEKSRKEIRKIISKTLQLDVVEQTESDLSDTLDLLEDSLFLLERIMSRHSYQQLRTEMVNHMESVADHLQQWGMGESKAAESRALTDKQVADVMKDRFRD